MLNFIKRRRILKYLSGLKSAITGEVYDNFLTTIKFEKNKVSLIFQFSGEKPKDLLKNFEQEVKNIALICGFKPQ